MSDFLNNLIARSFNRLAVFQPRTASFFEPQSSAFAPPLSHNLRDEQPDTSLIETEIGPTDLSPKPSTTPQTPPLHLPTDQAGKDNPSAGTLIKQAPDNPLQPHPAEHHLHQATSRPLSPAPSDALQRAAARDRHQTAPQQTHDKSQASHLKESGTTHVSPSIINTKAQQENLQKAKPAGAVVADNASQHSKAHTFRPTLKSTPTDNERLVPRSEAHAVRTIVGPTVDEHSTEQSIAHAVHPPSNPAERVGQSSPHRENRTPRRQALIEASVQRIVERVPASQQPAAVAPRVESLPVGRALTPQMPRPLVVAPLVKKHSPPVALKHDEPPAMPDETHAIQVTIGRVEIRAAQPALPRVSSQRPAGPAMSLGEYLSRRNKGGTR